MVITAGGSIPWLIALALVVAPPVALSHWPAQAAGQELCIQDDHAEHTAQQPHHTPGAVIHTGNTAVPQDTGSNAWDGQVPPWAWESEGSPSVVEAGESLAAAIAAAAPGDHIIVRGGVHKGPFHLDKPVWLEGQEGAVLTGEGQGTLLKVNAAGVRISGFTLRGSGKSLNLEDSGIYLEDSPQAIIAGNHIEDVLFGIVAKQSPNVQITGNSITGKDIDLSLAGDGIRVWHSDDARILYNTVQRTREVLVENSSGVEIRGNAVIDGRQGLHLMRSPKLASVGNFLAGNSNGIYLMYGGDAVIRDNRVLTSRGPSGYGLGLKEADAVQVTGNLLAGNRVGIYVDNSPLRQDRPNTLQENFVAYNDVGVLLTPASRGNLIAENDFMDNLQQVSGTGGGGGGANNEWSYDGQGNYWSSYLGYDSDQDGRGDLPYTPVRAFEGWMDRRPELRWLWFSPVAMAVDFAARSFPIGNQEPWLTDPYPSIAPIRGNGRP